ncbi:MAG: hypothetical protein MSA50_09975 [Veillonellaceae bacterium]|nr:hypothetical protein [Veillonellaceae bacterium]MDD6697930.1 hypothetical protein [Veillonellaceae bacterium]
MKYRVETTVRVERVTYVDAADMDEAINMAEEEAAEELGIGFGEADFDSNAYRGGDSDEYDDIFDVPGYGAY